MKVWRAIKGAVNRSGGDEDKAKELLNKQRELSKDEAADAYIKKLIEQFLARGYSLERPDELIEVVVARLKRGPDST